MSNIRKAIMAEANSDAGSVKEMLMVQKLNKLFYEKPNLDEEIRFLQIKRGSDSHDRVGLHASAILASDNEFCYREQVLSLFFKQLQGQQFAVGTKRIFMEGDSVHEKWQRLFIRGGLGKPEDMDRTRMKKKYDLSFTPDAILTINGKKYVVEIKSQSTFPFKKTKGHPGGMKQLKFYMLLCGIYDGFVLVEDKNSQDFKVLIADYNEEELAVYKRRLMKVQKFKQIFIEERKMPTKICDTWKDKRCQKCNMRNACWNKGEGRIEL